MKEIINQIADFLVSHKKSAWLAAIVILLFVPLLLRNPFYQDLLIQIFFWGTLASAWNLLGGFAGQISLGHAAFFGIGAYTSTILYLNFGISPWIGMFVGAGISSVVAVIIGLPCFRMKSHFFALATLAFAEVIRLLASYWRDLTNGGVGLQIPNDVGFANYIFESKTTYVYVIMSLFLGILLVSSILSRSRLGYYLIALREDENAAESLGANTTKSKLIALIISVVFTSMGGTFYAQYYQFIDPDIVFTSYVSIQLALLSIIGGIGTILGPIIGASFLVPLEVSLRGWLGGVASGLNFVVYGVILICAVRYFPNGIYGGIRKLITRSEDTVEKIIVAPVSCEPEIERNKIEYTESRPSKPLMVVDSLSKRFGGLDAVKDLSFTVNEGEILGLIGPNGAGKTTVFNLISGFLRPDNGTINFAESDITGLRKAHRYCKEGIGRTFQIVKPFEGMSVLENVMVGVFNRDRDVASAKDKAFDILDRIHLADKAATLSCHLTLAHRKRLELGRALATRPELLLLDEVIAGLNPKETEELIEVVKGLRKEGVTVLMIEHVMKAVTALSDRIVVINSGMKIAEGSPEKVMKEECVIQAYLGEQYHASVA